MYAEAVTFACINVSNEDLFHQWCNFFCLNEPYFQFSLVGDSEVIFVFIKYEPLLYGILEELFATLMKLCPYLGKTNI